MKATRITFWVSTVIIFLFQGVMPVLTGHTEEAKEGVRHLGYPEYFGIALIVAKATGAIVLIVPQIPKRLKEWAYAGFTFDFIFAAISLWAVDGFSGEVLFPFIVLAILLVSYFSYHKLENYKNKPKTDLGD